MFNRSILKIFGGDVWKSQKVIKRRSNQKYWWNMQPEELLFTKKIAISTLKDRDSSKPSTDFHWHLSELIITMSSLSATLKVTKSFSREGWAGAKKQRSKSFREVSMRGREHQGNNYFIKTFISFMPSSTCLHWCNMQYRNAHQTPLIDLTRIMCMCWYVPEVICNKEKVKFAGQKRTNMTKPP